MWFIVALVLFVMAYGIIKLWANIKKNTVGFTTDLIKQREKWYRDFNTVISSLQQDEFFDKTKEGVLNNPDISLYLYNLCQEPYFEKELKKHRIKLIDASTFRKLSGFESEYNTYLQYDNCFIGFYYPKV